MSSIDPRVAAIIDRPSHNTDSDDEDALISALEDDSSLDAFREQRLQQLHSEFIRAKQMRASDYGTYTEIKDEKTLMDLVKDTKLAVVHFGKADFGRCGVMDRHLEALAPTHFDTRFLHIDVNNAPFLVTKLKIQVLPCVLAFIDGVGVDRIVGFEGLSHNPDNFTTRELETRLLSSGVLVRAKVADGGGVRGFGQATRKQTKEESDDDADEWD
ncbi:hypothetical protein LTR04_004387 [Oleoguttula sp. CCFEE 6159]|nr:hypothetical protein LTR04_004387 [Oleoguttula sp. CCFEE 6159]